MRFHIIAVSQKMPAWINTGFSDYQKRFSKENTCILTEIPLQKRSKVKPLEQQIEAENIKIKSKIIKPSKTIALDVKGSLWSTEQLSQYLLRWQQETSTVNFIIGGPDGLSQNLLNNVDYRWSLSPLTFPHPIVRILLIEQLYRALCILKGHPYHRD